MSVTFLLASSFFCGPLGFLSSLLRRFLLTWLLFGSPFFCFLFRRVFLRRCAGLLRGRGFLLGLPVAASPRRSSRSGTSWWRGYRFRLGLGVANIGDTGFFFLFFLVIFFLLERLAISAAVSILVHFFVTSVECLVVKSHRSS